MKSWTSCYMEGLPTSSYIRVINFKKWSVFGPPCTCSLVCRLLYLSHSKKTHSTSITNICSSDCFFGMKIYLIFIVKCSQRFFNSTANLSYSFVIIIIIRRRRTVTQTPTIIIQASLQRKQRLHAHWYKIQQPLIHYLLVYFKWLLYTLPSKWATEVHIWSMSTLSKASVDLWHIKGEEVDSSDSENDKHYDQQNGNVHHVCTTADNVTVQSLANEFFNSHSH